MRISWSNVIVLLEKKTELKILSSRGEILLCRLAKMKPDPLSENKVQISRFFFKIDNTDRDFHDFAIQLQINRSPRLLGVRC